MKAGRYWQFRGLFVLPLVVLALAVALAACGGSSSSSSSGSTGSPDGSKESAPANAEEGATEGGMVKVNVGSEEIEVKKGTPKIGFFAYGLSAYELAYKEQLEEMNEKDGTDVTWIEAKYEATLQLKQLQTALTTGEYEAIVIEAVDPEGSCHILSEQAPQAGVVVSIITQPICGRGGTTPWGPEVWTPGTLNSVGAVAGLTFFENVVKEQKELFGITGSTKVGVINGPDISADAQAYKQAVKNAGIKPVEEAAGDFTAPTAQKLTSAMLSRNPEIEVILNGYEGATPGEIAALKEIGKKPGEIKLGDVGGSKEITVPNIQSGWLTATGWEDPKVIAKVAIEEVDNAFNGKQGPRFLDAVPSGCTLEKPCLITAENINTFKPTY